MNNALTVDEQRLLRFCEETIERDLHTFYAVGKALLTIRKQKLYRQTHSTFEHYCKDRWHFTAHYARNHIAAWETREILQKSGTFPANERQSRPLRILPADQRAEAWKEALLSAGGVEKVTCRHVAAVVESLRSMPAKSRKVFKITLRLCQVCGYSFSDEHHLKNLSSGGRRFDRIALCPNHHRYATILQQQMLDSLSREEIEAYAKKHFDSAFNKKLLSDILDRSYEISNGLSETFNLLAHI
jgi:hypothetical protein